MSCSRRWVLGVGFKARKLAPSASHVSTLDFGNRVRLGFGMDLPVNPPVLPMLANRVSDLPPGEGWVFEPKWDGFRALIFRDGGETFIQSRDEKPLDRYFPELLEPIKSQLPERCVLDGEIVIATG